jgi:hypothetical protein
MVSVIWKLSSAGAAGVDVHGHSSPGRPHAGGREGRAGRARPGPRPGPRPPGCRTQTRWPDTEGAQAVVAVRPAGRQRVGRPGVTAPADDTPTRAVSLDANVQTASASAKAQAGRESATTSAMAVPSLNTAPHGQGGRGARRLPRQGQAAAVSVRAVEHGGRVEVTRHGRTAPATPAGKGGRHDTRPPRPADGADPPRWPTPAGVGTRRCMYAGSVHLAAVGQRWPSATACDPLVRGRALDTAAGRRWGSGCSGEVADHVCHHASGAEVALMPTGSRKRGTRGQATVTTAPTGRAGPDCAARGAASVASAAPAWSACEHRAARRRTCPAQPRWRR